MSWFIVTGRMAFDDEDSVEIIECASESDAHFEFKQRMIDGVEFYDQDARPIYINNTLRCETEPTNV